MQFVTLEDAKFHLYVTDATLDPHVTAYLERASAVIWDYLKKPAAEAPAAAEASPVVQAATLLLVAHFWEHRGDDAAPDNPDPAVWNAIALLLMRSRDPALA